MSSVEQRLAKAIAAIPPRTMQRTVPPNMPSGSPPAIYVTTTTPADLAADIAAALAPLVRELRAEAFDRGWNAACDYLSPDYDGPDDPPNPYEEQS